MRDNLRGKFFGQGVDVEWVPVAGLGTLACGRWLAVAVWSGGIGGVRPCGPFTPGRWSNRGTVLAGDRQSACFFRLPKLNMADLLMEKDAAHLFRKRLISILFH